MEWIPFHSNNNNNDNKRSFILYLNNTSTSTNTNNNMYDNHNLNTMESFSGDESDDRIEHLQQQQQQQQKEDEEDSLYLQDWAADFLHHNNNNNNNICEDPHGNDIIINGNNYHTAAAAAAATISSHNAKSSNTSSSNSSKHLKRVTFVEDVLLSAAADRCHPPHYPNYNTLTEEEALQDKMARLRVYAANHHTVATTSSNSNAAATTTNNKHRTNGNFYSLMNSSSFLKTIDEEEFMDLDLLEMNEEEKYNEEQSLVAFEGFRSFQEDENHCSVSLQEDNEDENHLYEPLPYHFNVQKSSDDPRNQLEIDHSNDTIIDYNDNNMVRSENYHLNYSSCNRGQHQHESQRDCLQEGEHDSHIDWMNGEMDDADKWLRSLTNSNNDVYYQQQNYHQNNLSSANAISYSESASEPALSEISCSERADSEWGDSEWGDTCSSIDESDWSDYPTYNNSQSTARGHMPMPSSAAALYHFKNDHSNEMPQGVVRSEKNSLNVSSPPITPLISSDVFPRPSTPPISNRSFQSPSDDSECQENGNNFSPPSTDINPLPLTFTTPSRVSSTCSVASTSSAGSCSSRCSNYSTKRTDNHTYFDFSLSKPIIASSQQISSATATQEDSSSASAGYVGERVEFVLYEGSPGSSLTNIIAKIHTDSHKIVKPKRSSSLHSDHILSRNNAMLFPGTLHVLLSQPSTGTSICWLPHGRAFIVKNSSKLESEVLPRYFKQTKFKSFIRQLNKWGFKRLNRKGSDEGAYYHELFLRGMPWLITSMRYVKIKGTSTSGGSISGNSIEMEPDFNALNRVRPLISRSSKNANPTHKNYPDETYSSSTSSPTSMNQHVMMHVGYDAPMMPVIPMMMYPVPTVSDATQAHPIIPTMQYQGHPGYRNEYAHSTPVAHPLPMHSPSPFIYNNISYHLQQQYTSRKNQSPNCKPTRNNS